jgi:hypothetical protein
MSQNRHWRNGVHRRRWTCPKHKEGIRKTVVGKPCPTCGATSESIAAERDARQNEKGVLE